MTIFRTISPCFMNFSFVPQVCPRIFNPVSKFPPKSGLYVDRGEQTRYRLGLSFDLLIQFFHFTGFVCDEWKISRDIHSGLRLDSRLGSAVLIRSVKLSVSLPFSR